MNLDQLLSKAINCAIEAGQEIMNIYMTDDLGIAHKEDNSPLTKADLFAHEIISNTLAKTNIPILSEEGKHAPFSERKQWSRLWIIDPIDGTKEFINRNGEFTINIALVENENPILGVIYAPAINTIYFAAKNIGSFKLNNISGNESAENLINNSISLPCQSPPENFTIVASRSHSSKETDLFIKTLERQYGKIETKHVGSSLKLCMIAEGSAHIYPRFVPTMEWDIAAGHAICLFANSNVIDYKTDRPMTYNRENLQNNWFMASRQTLKP